MKFSLLLCSVSLYGLRYHSCCKLDCIPKRELLQAIRVGLQWVHFVAFSALTLLSGQQEVHLAHKNWVMRCWYGHLSAAKCKWFVYGPADATATPSSLASLKSRMVLSVWYQLIQVVLEKRPLNRCSSSTMIQMPPKQHCQSTARQMFLRYKYQKIKQDKLN